MDPLAVVQENILSTKVEICKAEHGSAKARATTGLPDDPIKSADEAQKQTCGPLMPGMQMNRGGRLGRRAKLYMRDKPRGCP